MADTQSRYNNNARRFANKMVCRGMGKIKSNASEFEIEAGPAPKPSVKNNKIGPPLSRRRSILKGRHVPSGKCEKRLTRNPRKGVLPRCGPGIVSDDGKCIPATASNVFGIPRTAVVSTRRQKSTLTRQPRKGVMPRCGPGTIVSDDGKCIPVTASNVFGMTKTTVGRTPVPSDYSCENKKPTSDLMVTIIKEVVTNANNAMEYPKRGVITLTTATAMENSKDMIFTPRP